MPKTRFKEKIDIGPRGRFLGYADSGSYQYDVWISKLGDRIYVADQFGNVGTWAPSAIMDMAKNGVQWAMNIEKLLEKGKDPSISPNAA